MGRWVRFFLAISLGIALGLYYAWVINPVEFVDTTPDTLREDYKADFVLMVAEVYQVTGDLDQAARSLGLLGNDSPIELARQAIVYTSKIPQYAEADRALLESLLVGFQSWTPTNEGRSP